MVIVVREVNCGTVGQRCCRTRLAAVLEDDAVLMDFILHRDKGR